MYRFIPLFAIVLILNGCGPQADKRNASEQEASPAADQSASEAMKQPIAPPTEPPPPEGSTPPGASASVCTPEWFAWVQQQIIGKQNGDMAKLYPSGLPAVGSDEWFAAVTMLTGGNLSGVIPGSTEWCDAIQKRLTQTESQTQ
ncbi:hypothetical protein [Microbulbifer sp. GL-2]|uniref:hypothetical protein n=1 Tax=Microbulbifer sp. GL-2 TaxID=2591606 RepID=UPI001162ED4D|nr:hypothetical protein [Microbulbifer sp. GL-2]BBM00101.1 hypothetical protein GL2_01750 [Microbulbifer sp. GL-2]